jgi:hypothetical protein
MWEENKNLLAKIRGIFQKVTEVRHGGACL